MNKSEFLIITVVSLLVSFMIFTSGNAMAIMYPKDALFFDIITFLGITFISFVYFSYTKQGFKKCIKKS